MLWIGLNLQKYQKMKHIPKNINWDATAFFERLATSNKLAKTEEFHFCRVSGLEGFEEYIHSLQSTANFIAGSDIAQGCTELNTTPHTRRVRRCSLPCVTLLMIWKHVRSAWTSCVSCSVSLCLYSYKRKRESRKNISTSTLVSHFRKLTDISFPAAPVPSSK